MNLQNTIRRDLSDASPAPHRGAGLSRNSRERILHLMPCPCVDHAAQVGPRHANENAQTEIQASILLCAGLPNFFLESGQVGKDLPPVGMTITPQPNADGSHYADQARE
jgi:hypothetical protein